MKCVFSLNDPVPKSHNGGEFPLWNHTCHKKCRNDTSKENKHMLWTIFVVLLVLWLLGLVTSYTMGGLVHVLLVVALVVLVIQLLQGRRVV